MNAEKPGKLWNQTSEIILNAIRSMRRGENRLEPEEELTRRLEVSRATVREAMQVLVREGYITRRHGKGNFAHPSVGELGHRIDLTADFLKLLSADGRVSSCRCLRCGYGPASETMRARFPAPCGTVYEQLWLYQADNQPMIFCKVSLPKEMLLTEPDPPAQNQDLVEWISHYCGRDFAYYATHLDCKADSEANWALELPEETVLQNWHEVAYDLSDTPVGFCDIFFHRENMDLSMVLRP